jgi:hypothetical protein
MSLFDSLLMANMTAGGKNIPSGHFLKNEVKDMTLPKAPQSVNADFMTEDEIHAKLQEGCDDIKAGKVQDAAEKDEDIQGPFDSVDALMEALNA